MELDTSTNRLYVGDDYPVTRETDTDPLDEIVEAWLTLKESEFDIIPKLQIHVTDDSVGHITEDSSDKTMLTFDMTAAQTSTLSAYVTYVYDVQVKYDSGKLKTVEKGTVSPLGEVTTEE